MVADSHAYRRSVSRGVAIVGPLWLTQQLDEEHRARTLQLWGEEPGHVPVELHYATLRPDAARANAVEE
jgi:hypothetical protein